MKNMKRLVTLLLAAVMALSVIGVGCAAGDKTRFEDVPADADYAQAGVYAVWVTFDGKTYMGMLNIGVRPTIGNGPNRTIEVNILHFHSDIYDKFIRLTFVKRTRPELKYDSIDELIAQLHKDAEETEAILLAAKQEK